jgi:N-formylglutamate deformylase
LHGLVLSMSSAGDTSVQPHVVQAANPLARIPLVVDSPHSGLAFPKAAGCMAPPDALLTSWDAYVDRLWAATPEVGGALMSATFHRAFIDANRDELDVDPELLGEAWAAIRPTPYSARGMGLIRRWALPGVPMYDRPLAVADVKARIERYYRPYHDTLKGLLDEAWRQFGAVWHIDCHSMKSTGNAMNFDSGKPRPDVVVSDGEGTTADPAFTLWAARCWRDLGYRVGINDPYKGGGIVRRYGAPAHHRHSIQIEFNRKLYMKEESFEPNEGMDKLQDDVRTFLIHLRSHITLVGLPQVSVQPAATRRR